VNLKKADDYIPSTDFTKFFITGDFGTGKSEFAASFPTPGFVFNTDKKIGTYQRYGGWDYVEYDLSPQGWVEFEKDMREVGEMVAAGKYKTVVADSTTSMSDIAMERSLQLDPKRSPTQGPIWNVHFMMVRNLMEGMIRRMLNFNCNLVLIAHLNIITDQETGAVLGIDPLLTGQLAVRVPGYFEEVYCAFTRTKEGGGVQWYLRTIPRGFYKARSTLSGREGFMPPEIDNTYDAVIQAYKDGVLKQKAKAALAARQKEVKVG